ncbi:ureidoglycolate lyase [Puniceibacterium confluentis]|uniref:ureidoglycolate lyase n=1 Tax=Puniceibacterium confluentis TaxID=1958944 RepID=UPI00356A95CF
MGAWARGPRGAAPIQAGRSATHGRGDGTRASCAARHRPLLAEPEWVEVGPAPRALHAFPAAPGRGVNLHRGTLHGVLTWRHGAGLFAVIDGIGSPADPEKFWLNAPDSIIAPGH